MQNLSNANGGILMRYQRYIPYTHLAPLAALVSHLFALCHTLCPTPFRRAVLNRFTYFTKCLRKRFLFFMIIFFFRLVLCLFQRDTRRLGGFAKREWERECVCACVCVCKRMWQMCARGEADNIPNERNKSRGERETERGHILQAASNVGEL